MSERNIELVADRWKVHASEKISTGDYENHTTSVSLEGEIPRGADLDQEGRKELKARLLAVQREIQSAVERAAENRIREEGHEDWGVRNGEES